MGALGPVILGPFGPGLDAAKREDMYTLDQKIGVGRFVLGKSLDHLGGLEGQEELGHIPRPSLKHRGPAC